MTSVPSRFESCISPPALGVETTLVMFEQTSTVYLQILASLRMLKPAASSLIRRRQTNHRHIWLTAPFGRYLVREMTRAYLFYFKPFLDMVVCSKKMRRLCYQQTPETAPQVSYRVVQRQTMGHV